MKMTKMDNIMTTESRKLNLLQSVAGLRRYTALLVLLSFLGIGDAWGSSYYAKLTASVANGTGSGTVYVATPTEEAEVADNDPSKHDASSSGTSSDKSSTDFYFTAYATAARGSMFSTWSNLSGDGNPAIYEAGGYSLTSNPILVKVTSASSDGTNEATIKANFVVNPVPTWEVEYIAATNGTYTATGPSGYGTITPGSGTKYETYNNDDIKMVASPASGYVLYRYYGIDADDNKYTIGELGASEQTINIPVGTVKVGAEFTNKHYLAAENLHNTLKEAIQALRKNDGTYAGTILLIKDDELTAGYYTIPVGVTLLIPVDGNQTKPRPIIERKNENNTIPKKAYKKLTMANNAHLDVFGAIEVGGRQNNYDNVGTGRPQGTYYGQLEMSTGSTITLESGSNLYAWGYITGDGEIDVRRGANVHEQFQIYDWHGGGQAYTLYSNKKGVFVVNQYFIQNVEAKAKYRPGSALYTYTGLVGESIDAVKVIGVDGDAAAMFTMNNEDDSEDTWVCKYYNYSTDQQIYDINNAAKVGNLVISAYGYDYNSSSYTLPITCNMKIHVLNGKMQVRQNTVMLPGSEIEIDKEATGYIDPNMSLFLVDSCDWGKWVFNGVYAQRIEVRPGGVLPTDTQRKILNADGSCALAPAKLNVHGTFVAEGDIYTSYAKNVDNTLTESNRGASIISNNADAGTFVFVHTAPTAEKSVYVRRYKDAWPEMKCVSAKLLNGDGTYATTAGTPAGQSYCYMNGKWTMMTVDPDNECFVYDNYGTYYAKPGAYVALANGKTANNDHTYSDADGRGRLYILMDECQWWEVENDNNLYKGITRDENDVASWNGKYYVYNTSTNKWEEKRYTITWKDWNGTVITTYQLTYGSTPQYLSTNPTRSADVDYTYNFTGWSPAFAPVTGDQTYTATYSKEQIKYTIIFKFVDSYHDGAEIERQQLVRDAMPVVPTIKRAGWYLKWTPAISAVTGNATYEADWMEELPDNYTITWKNYDGITLSTTTPARDAVAATVLAGSPANPTKPATSEYRYEFAGWAPTVAAATADAVYTAQYNEIKQTYAIRFYQENGSTQIGATQNLTMGAAPVVPAYGKANTAQYTYQLQWKNMATNAVVGVSVPSVSGAADYKADFTTTTNRYSVSAVCATPSSCVITGSGVYDYGTEVTLTATPNTGYEFVKWSDNVMTSSRAVTVTGNATYTVVVRPIGVEIPIGEQRTIALPTTVASLTITANAENSGQLIGAENMSLIEDGKAYFDLTLNTWARHWHAFSVPFMVDLTTTPIVETKTKKGVATNRTLVLGRDYDIVYYNENTRANQGAGYWCWDYVEDMPSNKILTPGKGYMIAFASAVGTIRFTKKDGEPIVYGGSVSVSYSSGDAVDAGWNGIGNPTTYHALLDAGVTECQVHTGDTIGSDGYTTYELSDKKLVVGKAVFVQAPAPKSVVVTRATTEGVVAAPSRNNSKASEQPYGDGRYDVHIASTGGASADHIYLLTDEDKEDKYVVVADLAKAGVSKVRAQMWVNRYGVKLCKNTIVPTGSQAIYPLGIYAPATGAYEIYVTAQPDATKDLYLTYDGNAIWNLSRDGAYMLQLTQGTTEHYGLRVSIHEAPQVATGADEAIVDNKDGAPKKVILNENVYIIRNGKMYSVTGQEIR